MVEAFAEDIIAIADDSTKDTAATAKLRVDARRWLMTKLMPKKYGERTAVEHSGTVNVPLTLEEFRARIAEAKEAREP